MKSNKIINENFDIPFHIFDEIVEYVGNGKPAYMWKNIYTLIKMAENNNILTTSQVNFLIDNYK